MPSRDAAESPRSGPRLSGAGSAATSKDGGAGGLLSPRFRSAAELAGWDEESVLLAALIVEDTPARESRRKRRSSTSAGVGGSTGSNTRKRRFRRQPSAVIPPVTLALDDDDNKTDMAAGGKKDVNEKEDEKVVVVGEKEASGSGENADAMGKLPCMDRLREELSCAICLDICFEPSTTPCGHSFCLKCLKHAATKCGKLCPKCRQLISNSRSCIVNTVLWNTIQLLFPNEVDARTSSCNDDVTKSPPRSSSFPQGGIRTRNSSGGFVTEGRTRSCNRNFVTPGSTTSSNTGGSFMTAHGSMTSSNTTSEGFISAHRSATSSSNTTSGGFISAHGSTRHSNSRRGFIPASQMVTNRSSYRSDQSDAALAYRLQQEEFMNSFESGVETRERLPRNTVSSARENLRAMASRAIRLRSRGWPI